MIPLPAGKAARARALSGQAGRCGLRCAAPRAAASPVSRRSHPDRPARSDSAAALPSAARRRARPATQAGRSHAASAKRTQVWSTRPAHRCSRRDRLVVGRQPAPGTGPITALQDSLLVDLGNDNASVARQQRFGRAHFRAHRQLALREPISEPYFAYSSRLPVSSVPPPPAQ